jgi:hypothetical protein
MNTYEGNPMAEAKDIHYTNFDLLTMQLKLKTKTDSLSLHLHPPFFQIGNQSADQQQQQATANKPYTLG